MNFVQYLPQAATIEVLHSFRIRRVRRPDSSGVMRVDGRLMDDRTACRNGGNSRRRRKRFLGVHGGVLGGVLRGCRVLLGVLR
jgi:hypothetical protein